MTDAAAHTEPHPDVAGYLLGTLTDEEAAHFETHLAGCAACRGEVDELGDLPGLLAGLPPFEELPPGLEARTFEAIEREAARAPRSDPAGDADGVRAAGGTIVPIEHARARRRWSTAQLVLTAAAAGVVAVVGLDIGVKVADNQPAPVAVEQLVAPNGGPARGTATVHATLTGATIDLHVTGLAPSPPGTIYTCWLVGKGDTLAHQNRVSVGSFVVGSSGTANVQWDTGANLQRFPKIGVTLEPDNGNPLHQGPKVLQV